MVPVRLLYARTKDEFELIVGGSLDEVGVSRSGFSISIILDEARHHITVVWNFSIIPFFLKF